MSTGKRQFQTIDQTAVPHTRKGKHHPLVEQILAELGELRSKKALRIPRSAFGSAKVEHIRAALSRASGRQKLDLATSSDDEYFYVWREN